MNWYPRHLGDYARDAGHLSLAEHGAYTLLLDRFYATEKPFSEKEAMQICRPANKREREFVRRILADFFQSTKEGFINKRALEEITKAHEKSHKAQISAGQRWMRTHSERNANGMLTNNHQPITTNQNPKSPPAKVLAIATQRSAGFVNVGELAQGFSKND